MSESDKVLRDMEEGGDGMTKYGNMLLEFIKKEIFQERKNVSVEEIVTLIATLTDVSVGLLANFRQDPMADPRVAEIGRDEINHMAGRLGCDIGQIVWPPLYTKTTDEQRSKRTARIKNKTRPFEQ